jgi:outer membrane protein assembly factor BamD (BamD/ComL family)
LKKMALLFLCFSAGLTGCIHIWTPTAQVTELQNADNLFDQKKYSDAVTAYRKILKASPAPRPAVAANAQYGVALTLAYYDNPQRNYAQAIQELDEFLRLYPTDSRVSEVQNLRFILRSLIDVKKDNEHLNKSIEQLKRLDIRHEERRGEK